MLDYAAVDYTVGDYYDDYDVTTVGPSSNRSGASFNGTSALHARDEGLARVEVAVQALIFVLALVGNTCVLIALK